MRNLLRVMVCCVSVLLFDSAGALAADPGSTRADTLVREALQAEVDDSSDLRQQKLAEALRVAPDHAPARWHAGQVRLGDAWVDIEDVAAYADSDRLLLAYQKRRLALVNTADSHRELARWCGKHQLPGEARVHWGHVLAFHPQDAEALRALQSSYRDGQLVSRQQLEQEKQTTTAQQRRLREAKPTLEAWQRTLQRGDPSAVERLLTELRGLRKTTDVPVLMAVLSLQYDGRHADSLRDAVFEALGQIRSPDVTQFFLRIAVEAPAGAVRDAAIEQLRKRPAYAFVPQLLDAMPPEISARGEVNVLPGGTVVHERQVRVAGRDAEATFNYENVVAATDLAAAARSTPHTMQRELTKAVLSEAQIHALQQQAQQRRNRIHEVLTRATEFSIESADNWEREYERYYGLYTPEREKRFYSQQFNARESYITPATETTTVISNHRAYRSCFVAGTQVATFGGLRAIETLQVGDRVLTQNTVSGELAYQSLTDTTLRPAIELIEIRIGSRAPILTTPGHPFWVVGQGWQLARLLRPGDRLHSVHGAVLIDDVQSRPPAEAYNLVVDDFHTYFVGDDMLLVHDNAPLVEQPQLVPGL